MPKIVRLEHDTIVEATFEIRFESTINTAADLLPGILFAEFKGRFPKTLRTAASDLPRQFQHLDPNLKYTSRQGIGNDEFQILIGDFAVQISTKRPYVGWERFMPTILDVLALLEKSGFVKRVERFSLKYANLVEGKSIPEQMSHIRLKAHLGQTDLTSLLTIIRTEIHKEGLNNIVELAPTTKVRLGELELEGIMISVDSIQFDPQDFWGNREKALNKAHDVEKEIYFDILTQETIAALKPTYQ